MPIDKVLSGYHRFKEKFAAEQDVFVRLAEEGQNPKVLWIGCSDSRIIPEQITGAEAGELFVMRNIANVVPPFGTTGDAVGAVIEYAVLHLGVPHIVICGHTECGGIKALDEDIDMAREPHIARWLELARPARARLETSEIPEEERHLEMIKANVLLQIENLQTYSCVREAASNGKLIIHGWLYDLHAGNLIAYDYHSEEWKPLT
ncbi:MAG: carbonic anhydrase [Syntrophales bacterium]|nr:carbonic anhydrase [Syntrophales bacterium]